MPLTFEASHTRPGALGALEDSMDIGKVSLGEDEFEAEMILSDQTYIPSYTEDGGGISSTSKIQTSESMQNTTDTMMERLTDTSEQNLTVSDVTQATEITIDHIQGDTVTPQSNYTPPPYTTPPEGFPQPVVISCEVPANTEATQTTQTGTQGNSSNSKNATQTSNSLSQSPSKPKGTQFFDPEEGCDSCCHAPTDGPSQFYTMCLLASTDPAITQMIENGMIEQVYSSIPALQEKFESGLPGAYLRETRFYEMTNNQIANLVDINILESPASMAASAGAINRSSIESYQFQRKLKFKLPKNCQHLTLFAFIRLDDIAFRDYYKMTTSAMPPGFYIGSIKEVSVIINSTLQTSSTAYLDAQTMRRTRTPVQRTANGQFYSFEPGRRTRPRKLIKIATPVGNIRSSQVLNNLIGVCSTSIYEAIQFSDSQNDKKTQSFFWLTKNSSQTSTLFFAYNQEQLIMENSFIKNLKSKEIYANQQIDSFEVEKVDLLDEDRNIIINSTTGARTKNGSSLRGASYSKTKNLDDQETISSSNGRVVLSNLAQMPDLARGLKMVQIIDKTPSPGKFAYRITFKFKEPTIEFLKNITSSFSEQLNNLQQTHSEIANVKKTSKSSSAGRNLFLKVIDASKKAIAKANQILSILPNKNYIPSQFINYMTCLANPKANSDDHETLMRVLRTLEQTLFSLLRNAGARITGVDDIGVTTGNTRSSSNKSKGFSIVTIQSQEFYDSNSTGIDFLSMGKTDVTSNSLGVTYDSSFMNARSDLEFKKFWNPAMTQTLGTAEASLKERAMTFFTPSKVHGIDEIIDFDKPESYGPNFEQKIKKIKLAKDKKTTVSNNLYSILDSLDGLPASFEIVPGDYRFSSTTSFTNPVNLSEKFLPSQTNFTQNNINTIKNKTKEVQTYDSADDIFITGVESSIVEGFNSMNEGPTIAKIKNDITLEEAVDNSGLAQLPPSMQAYKLRDLEASRFYEFVRVLGPLSDNSNQIYQKNYFGSVCKIQYASFGTVGNSQPEWKDYSPNIGKTSQILFCKFEPVENSSLRIGLDLNQSEIYNQYFLMETSATNRKVRQDPANLKPIPMLTPESLVKSEKSIGNRISSIMNQNTTYLTGVPVSYTRIIY